MKSDTNFAEFMEPVARAILGEPARKTKNKWYYGNHGSFVVDIQKGVWHDFENDCGGGVLDLIMLKKGLDKAGALDFLAELRCIEKPNSRIKEEAEAVKAASMPYDAATDPCVGIKIKKTPRKPKFEIVKTWASNSKSSSPP
jgi:hypothetical protein